MHPYPLLRKTLDPPLVSTAWNSSEVTDVSRPLLSVQLVWNNAKNGVQNKKQREIAARGCISSRDHLYFTPLVKLRRYLDKATREGIAYATKRCEMSQFVLQSVHVGQCCPVSKQNPENAYQLTGTHWLQI